MRTSSSEGSARSCAFARGSTRCRGRTGPKEERIVATPPTLEVVQCGHHILELHGELCMASLDRMTEALSRIDGPVTLYLSGLRFMDSTGLGLILKRLPVGPVTLLDVQPQVARVLKLSGLDNAEGLEIQLAR